MTEAFLSVSSISTTVLHDKYGTSYRTVVKVPRSEWDEIKSRLLRTLEDYGWEAVRYDGGQFTAKNDHRFNWWIFALLSFAIGLIQFLRFDGEPYSFRFNLGFLGFVAYFTVPAVIVGAIVGFIWEVLHKRQTFHWLDIHSNEDNVYIKIEDASDIWLDMFVSSMNLRSAGEQSALNQTEMLYCSYCGARNDPKVSLCAHCGGKL